jgi:hypothetical protein
MLEALDETIKQLVIQKTPLNTAEVDVSFDVPNREWSGSISKPTINIYLHDIRENLELKESGWNFERASNGAFTKSKPPNLYDMSYLITAWTTNVEDEHRLLWYVLSTLVRYPIIPKDVLQGQLSEQPQSMRTKIAQPDGVLRNVADVWTALDNQLKPVLPYVVTLTLDSEKLQVGPPVRSKFLRFYPPNSEDISSLPVIANGNSIDATEITELVQVGGYITDTTGDGRPVARAEVVLVEQGLNVATDAEGRYTFRNVVKRPQYTVLVVAPGYETMRQVVTIPAASYDFALQPQKVVVAEP